MQKTNKNVKILIILGLILITPFSSIIISSVTSIDFSNNVKDKLKSSTAWNSISINNLPGSLTNWSWAETQPWFGSGSGTEIDPYILEDLIVNGNLTDSCISISNSDVYFTIHNCTLLNSSSAATSGGITLSNVKNGYISGNYFNNHRNAGIYGSLTEHIIVSENTIENHRHGIYLDGNYNEILSNSIYGDGSGSGIVMQGVYHDNLIHGNIIEHCWQGMFIFSAINNTFSKNTAFKNFQHGIALTTNANNNLISENIVLNNSLSGIVIENSIDNVVVGTKAKENQQHGIYIMGADYSTIKHNRLIGNLLDGINIATGSFYNLIYHNFFGGNSRHAYDNGGSSNDWNSTTIGNYWDNHTSPDTSPADGIVDNPYLYINGAAGSIDYLPIAENGPPEIFINSPLDGQTFGTTAPSFTVTIIDAFIMDMWYSLDGGLTKYFFNANGTIDQEAWAALPEGAVTITFFVNDTASNLTSESVSVVKSIPDDSSIVIIIVIVSLISLGAVIVIGFFFIRKRKTPK